MMKGAPASCRSRKILPLSMIVVPKMPPGMPGRMTLRTGADFRDLRRSWANPQIVGPGALLTAVVSRCRSSRNRRAPRAVSPARLRSSTAARVTGGEDDLRDAHAARHREILVAEIDQQHLDLAAIVAVDRARRVEAGDAVLEGEAGARPHLALEAFRDFHDQAGRHQRALARQEQQRPVLRHGGAQVHAGRAGGLIGRQGEAVAMRQPDEADGSGNG